MSRVEVVKRGLTLRTWILCLLTILIGIPYSVMVEIVGIGTDSIFIPFFMVVLINQVLPRRIRLTPQELAILFVPLFAFAGKAFIVNGDGRERLGATVYLSTIGPMIYAVNNEPYAELYWKLMPSFMLPPKEFASYAWNGLPRGVALNWGAWMAPIVYWTIFSASWMLFVIFLVFGLLGPQWYEVERLTFPMAIPTAYLLTTIEEEVGGKNKLFNVKLAEMKYFWSAFIVGAIVSAVVALGDVIPAFGLYTEVWEKHMFFDFISAAIGPGAHVRGVLIPHQAMLFLLVPFDVLWTAIIVYIVVGLIWQPLAVRAGLAPYQPGVERWSNWWFGYRPPFPYAFMALGGLSAGVAIYSLWLARDRLKKLYTALRGSDVVEHGISLKMMGGGLLALTIFLLVFWTASGVPPVMSIILLVTYSLWLIADARVMSEVWWHDPVYWFYVYYWIHPAGVALGQWPATLPTTSTGRLVTEQVVSAIGNWIPRHSPMGSGFTTQYYYVVRRTKTSVKDALTMYVVTAVLGSFVTIVFAVWFYNFYGLVRNPGYSGYLISYTCQKGVLTGEALTLPPDQVALWTIIGFVLAFALYWIRAVIPGFIINPVALIPALWLMEFMWLAAIIAIIAKYVLIRAMGPAKFESVVIPIAAGLALGSGLFVWVGPLYKLFTVVIPRLAAAAGA